MKTKLFLHLIDKQKEDFFKMADECDSESIRAETDTYKASWSGKSAAYKNAARKMFVLGGLLRRDK